MLVLLLGCTGLRWGEATALRVCDIDRARRRIDLTLSHGRTGQCWDDALSESFFASLKGELTDTRPRPTRAAASRAIVEYIGWYNGIRLHSTLGHRSPAEFDEDNKINKVA